MIEGLDCRRALISSNRGVMKRATEGIGVDLGVKSDGCLGYECGEIGYKHRAKRPRVFGTTDDHPGTSVQVGMDVGGNENGGIDNPVTRVLESGYSEDEDSAFGTRTEDGADETIENCTTGVTQFGEVLGEAMISYGKEVCDGGDRELEGEAKENDKVSGPEELVMQTEARETEIIKNQKVGSEELGFRMEEDRISKRSEECMSGDRNNEKNENCHTRELGTVGLTSGFSTTRMSASTVIFDNAEGQEKWDYDLNVPVLEAEEEYSKVGSIIAERKVEIINISSDESDDEGAQIVDKGDARGNDFDINIGFAHESSQSFDLHLGSLEMSRAVDGSSSMTGERKYTREEKGKAKLVDSWLSLATIPAEMIPTPQRLELVKPAVSNCIQLYEPGQRGETTKVHRNEELEFRRERATFRTWRANTTRYRENKPCCPKKYAMQFARFNPQLQDYCRESLKPKQNMLSKETDKELKDLTSPFFSALKMVRERNMKCSAEKLIEWKPSEDHDCSISMPLVPSLLDLCLKVLSRHADAIVSLEPVPDALRQRLTSMICNYRGMNNHVLDLLVRGSPTEIRIKDCSSITEEQFTKTFQSFDGKNLRVLQLDLCAQCLFDHILDKTIARSSNSLPSLGIISLRGACRVSDVGLKALVAAAPALRSINLGQCSLLTYAAIDILANCLGSILRELYIDDCQRIDPMLIIPALKKFEHLEVLSVAGMQTVSDEFVNGIIATCGQNMRELDLADCLNLTDISLKIIGNTCPNLCSLNISNLHRLTDRGIQYLADGCRSIETLKLCRSQFSDEAIAAFLEISGQSLKELSLNNVSEVGPSSALSLAKHSRKLLSLDLSWCRKITNEALGLIVDSCLSLKLLKLFGCTQITTVFLNGHSNELVRIIGLNSTPVLEHLSMLEPDEVLLKYSPLPPPPDSQIMESQYV